MHGGKQTLVCSRTVHSSTVRNKQMKLRDTTIICFLLSIVSIIISSFILQQIYFDFHFVVALLIYSIPALVLSFLNGLILTIKEKTYIINFIKILIIPLLLLVGLALDFKGPLGYVAIFGLIPVIITNLMWIRKSSSE